MCEEGLGATDLRVLEAQANHEFEYIRIKHLGVSWLQGTWSGHISAAVYPGQTCGAAPRALEGT